MDAEAYREIAAMGVVRPEHRGTPPVRRPDAGLGLGRLPPRSSGPTRLSIAPRREVPRCSPIGQQSGPAALRPAVFLDRDGTLIEHVHYLSDPALVRLLPGAAEALRRLRSRRIRTSAGD